MSNETLLQLSLGKLPLQSARGIKHTLIPQSSNAPVRTIAGELINRTEQGFHKYRSIIEGEDTHFPPFDELLIGLEVRMGLANQLCRFVSRCEPGQIVKLSRTPQEASILLKTIQNERIDSFSLEGDSVTYTGDEAVEDLIITYRPWLLARVVDFSLCAIEKENKCAWRLVCDEI